MTQAEALRIYQTAVQLPLVCFLPHRIGGPDVVGHAEHQFVCWHNAKGQFLWIECVN